MIDRRYQAQNQNNHHKPTGEAEYAAQQPVKAPYHWKGYDVIQQIDHETHQNIQRDEAQQEGEDIEYRLPDGLIQVIRQGIDTQALEHLRPYIRLKRLGNHCQLVGNGRNSALYRRFTARNDL